MSESDDNCLLSKSQPELALRSEEHTPELQSPCNLVCRLLLEKTKTNRPGPKRPWQPAPYPPCSSVYPRCPPKLALSHLATGPAVGTTLSPARAPSPGHSRSHR